jgi:hypothetical protein
MKQYLDLMDQVLRYGARKDDFSNDIVGFAGGFFAHVTRGRSVAVQGTVRF